MAIVRANYVKRGREARARAKAHVRYIMHRRDETGRRVTRTLFGFDGALSKAQAYRMIDAAGRGSFFYRLKLSPDPKREDRLRDLDFSDLTLSTMLTLEERLGRHIAFLATVHDDHSAYRHIHALVITHRKLTRKDFAALRAEATARARTQRRQRDQALGLQAHAFRAPRARVLFAYQDPRRVLRRGQRPFAGYTCPLCGFYQLLPVVPQGHRCPSDGLFLRRDKGAAFARRRARGGWGLGRGLRQW